MTITVLICTWNRAHYLNQALGGMRALQIPSGLDWEVLVINNNSTDNTDEIIARHQKVLPVRRLFEPKPGKSNAANTGIRHAKGDLIVCTDDDVLVSPNWIAEYVMAEREWPDAAYFGGTIFPWFEVEPPAWIKEYLTLRGPYSVLQHGPEVRPFLPSEAGPFGANMAIRAAVLNQFSFDPRLGPKEDQILPADDGEFVARLKNAGHHGVWVGPASVRHHIAKELLTSRYIWQWYREQGRSLVLREGKADLKRVAGVPLWALRQHCTSRLSSWLLAPFKGERWVRAYTEAARTRGIIQETRALHDNPAPGVDPTLFKSTGVGQDQR